MIRGQHTYICLSGFIRSKGDADMAINEIAKTIPTLNLNL